MTVPEMGFNPKNPTIPREKVDGAPGPVSPRRDDRCLAHAAVPEFLPT
jgi:hypothetical protein